MAEKSEKPGPVAAGGQQHGSEQALISATGSSQAPFVYFEQASAFGHMNGVVRVTLEAMRIYPSPSGQGALADRVVTAHLRMSVQAAQSLKAALEGALLLAAPAESSARN